MALRKVAGRSPVMLACGGGVVLTPESRAILLDHFFTIYLKTAKTTLIERLRRETGRPLLDVKNPEEVISRLYDKRLPIYEAAADLTILTDAKEPAQIVDEAYVALKEAGP